MGLLKDDDDQDELAVALDVDEAACGQHHTIFCAVPVTGNFSLLEGRDELGSF